MGQRKIHIQDIIAGIKSGSIKIDEKGHLMNSLLDDLERHVEHSQKVIEEMRDKADKGELLESGTKPERMIEIYEEGLNMEIGLTHFHLGEVYCFNCGMRGKIIMTDEKTITVIGGTKFYEMRDKQVGFRLTDISLVESCRAASLTNKGFLSAEIEVPTGELVFQNFFREQPMYDFPKNDKTYREINNLKDRNELMQYLASNGVGYGQMGNMSLTVYANKNNEILLGSDPDHMADMIPDKIRYLNGDYGKKPEGEKLERHKRELQQMQDFESMLEKGKFKDKGGISLSMWRWVCADKSVIEKYGEKHDKDQDQVIVKVVPGTYIIEHYYDVNPCDGLYTRIKLKA